MAAWIDSNPGSQLYVSDQYLIDLVVWYHLGWMAETVRRGDQRVRALQDKAQGFTVHERRELLQVILEQLQSVIPRFSRLAKQGRVELAMSPYAHPILPLLLDISAGQQAQPDALRPAVDAYPGGRESARWHLRHGREVFERHFGMRAGGCWPSEGALSTETLCLLAEEGFAWTASGESVLRNSIGAGSELQRHGADASCRHRVYRVAGQPIDCFFRDDGLSDLIGFEYSGWHAEDAVANLVHHMENIAGSCPDCRNCATSIRLAKSTANANAACGPCIWKAAASSACSSSPARYRRFLLYRRSVACSSRKSSTTDHCWIPAMPCPMRHWAMWRTEANRNPVRSTPCLENGSRLPPG